MDQSKVKGLCIKCAYAKHCAVLLTYNDIYTKIQQLLNEANAKLSKEVIFDITLGCSYFQPLKRSLLNK